MKAVTNNQFAAENETLRARVAALEARAPVDSGALSPEDALRYRFLTESSFDIVSELDPNGCFQYLSPNYRDVLGWDPEAMLGTSALDIVHPEEREAAAIQIERSFVAGWGRLSLRVRHDDGDWRWFECIGRRFATNTGAPRILVISRDVSDRVRTQQLLLEAHNELETRVRQRTAELAETNSRLLQEIADRELAEQQLRSSEERLRKVVENVPDVVLSLDRDGTILSVDTPTSAGSADVNAVGSSVYAFVEPKHVSTMRTTIERVFNTGKPGEYEVQDIDKRDWYRTRVSPMMVDGRVTHVLLICANITAQKKAEQEMKQSHQLLERRIIERTQQLASANEQLRLDIVRREETERQLRESEERFRAIAEANPVPVLISRFADGRILFANERLCESLGAKREDLLKQSTTDYYKRAEDRMHLLRALSAEGHVTDYELEAKRKDGAPIWLWVSNRRITYQGESAVLTSFLDITERKHDEERLRHERTVLKQMLDLQDRDRQLTAYEIHDGLVQEMTGALLYLEAARSAETNRERMPNLERALALQQGSLNEARRLINGLRPPILDEQGVVPAVEHLIADLKQIAGMKVRLKDTLTRVRYSPALENTMYRVIQEALTNVRRHSGVLTASVDLVEEGAWIRITIRDRGKGFDPTKVPSSRYGLSGIQERARLFGGNAHVRSTLGKGTTVHVELPTADLLQPTDDDSDEA